VCKAATTNVGGTGHGIISLGGGDMSPSGNVNRGDASPARVVGICREFNPERIKVLLEAVDSQGEVCWIKVAEAIFQLLNSRCKC
jgi:hypothetical protein